MRLFFTTFILLFTFHVNATNYTVTNTNASGNGSLPDAIQTVNSSGNSNDTINITATGTLTLSSALTITNHVVIYGPSNGSFIISGNQTTNVFDIGNNYIIKINRLSIANAHFTYGGAGIGNGGSDLYLDACSFYFNESGAQGGVIWNGVTATLTVTNSTFESNTSANFGGAIANYGTATIINCTFANNDSGNGAIANYNTATLINCTFAENTPNAIFVTTNKDITLINCIVTDNGTGSDLSATGTITANNCIFGNTTNATVNGSNNKTATGAEVFGINYSLKNNGGPTKTFAILNPGPAVDAGQTGGQVLSKDQRGITRTTTPDIGSYESLTPSGVKDFLIQESTVYSNPSDGIFHLDLSEKLTGEITMKIYTPNGSLLQSTSIEKGNSRETYTIDLKGKPSGNYTLVLTNNQSNASLTLIKY
jgi:hypothetical protein